MKLQENRREIAAFALATGHTAAAAARKAKVTERTVHAWLAMPEYRLRVRKIRSEILDRAAGELANILTCSIATLKALLSSESDHVKLSAARTILETGLKFHEVTSLEDRIRRLEEGESEVQSGEAGEGEDASQDPGPDSGQIHATS